MEKGMRTPWREIPSLTNRYLHPTRRQDGPYLGGCDARNVEGKPLLLQTKTQSWPTVPVGLGAQRTKSGEARLHRDRDVPPHLALAKLINLVDGRWCAPLTTYHRHHTTIHLTKPLP